MLLYALAWLLSWLPDRWFQALCGRLQGHHYSATVMHEGGFFVIDPTVVCSHCALPMDDDVYETITRMYAAALSEESI